MAVWYRFHPEALAEYEEAADYYLREAPAPTAETFVAAVEAAISTVVVDPTRWRVVEAPGLRRYVVSRFPFVVYYR